MTPKNTCYKIIIVQTALQSDVRRRQDKDLLLGHDAASLDKWLLISSRNTLHLEVKRGPRKCHSKAKGGIYRYSVGGWKYWWAKKKAVGEI
jgi:hypothetical protein